MYCLLASLVALPPLKSWCSSLSDSFGDFLKFMDHLSYQCAQLLADEDLLAFLRAQHYDMAVIDAFNPCSFILARKLGKGENFVDIR